MSDHPFEVYFRKHGHYPQATIHLTSKFRIKVTVTRGYAIVSTYPLGVTTYIPRNKLVRLINWLAPMVRQMDRDWNVEAIFEEYMAEEAETQREIKRQKREAREASDDRKRRRYRAAQRRARRRQT